MLLRQLLSTRRSWRPLAARVKSSFPAVVSSRSFSSLAANEPIPPSSSFTQPSYAELYASLGGPARSFSLALDSGDNKSALDQYRKLTQLKDGFKIVTVDDFTQLINILRKNALPHDPTKIDPGFQKFSPETAAKIIEIYEDFFFSGLEGPAEIYEAAVFAFASVGQFEEVYRVYHEMLERRVFPTTDSYFAFLYTASETGHQFAMEQFLEELRAQTDMHVPPTASYYAMKLYYKVRSPIQVDIHFMEASRRWGAKNLHIDIWKVLIKIHIEIDAGLGERVDEIRQHMHNLGVKPDQEMTDIIEHYLHHPH